jgi:hypothetical protein
MAVIEEEIGDLDGHSRRRSGPATLKLPGRIVNVYSYDVISNNIKYS